MRVDLHLHSKNSIKNGDSISFNTFANCFRILNAHNVKVASFSDHNIFYAQEYLDNRKLAHQFQISLLPAVEIDIISRQKDRTANIIWIFDSELPLVKLQEIEKVINLHTGKRQIRIEKLYQLLKPFPAIIIPHVGKSDFCTYEDLQGIPFDAIEISSYQHHNYQKFKKQLSKNKEKTSVVAFSDTHIWKQYPQINKLYTWINNSSSFKDLKAQLALNKDYVVEV